MPHICAEVVSKVNRIFEVCSALEVYIELILNRLETDMFRFFFMTIIGTIIASCSAKNVFNKVAEYGSDIELPCPYFETTDEKAKWYKGANSTKLLASITNGTIILQVESENCTAVEPYFSLVCHNVLVNNDYTCETTSRKEVVHVEIKVETEVKAAVLDSVYCQVTLEINPPHLVGMVTGFNTWPKQKGKTCNSTHDPYHNQAIFPVKKWTGDRLVLEIPKENVSSVMCLETIYKGSFQSFEHQQFSPKNRTANINITSANLDSMHCIVTLGISPTYLKTMVSRFNILLSKQKGVTCENISDPNYNHDVQVVAVKEWKKIDSGFVLKIPKGNVSSVTCLMIMYKDSYQPSQYLNFSPETGKTNSRAGKMAAGELIISMATLHVLAWLLWC